MDNIEYQCPVCRIKHNSGRNLFISFRAVALHVAGKIKTSDSDHKIWAYENCGQENIDKAIDVARNTNGINIIGDLLLLPIKKWHDEKGKQNIGFKK